ncbi:G-protein coupled receptor [Lycorma delicatula]|uniref:G-protein coupled receptor n=1 Tax=Lycorma delicatula TaxID=130591 RepID=UPI003F50F72B
MNNETYKENYNLTTTDELFEREIINIVQIYYLPIVCIFGGVGNALSVFVFFSTKLRKLSSSYYLSALAISDTGVLIPIFVTWLELVDIIQIFNKPIICQTLVYMTHMCSFLSVWFVVSFTVERFIAVRYPLRRPSVCTVARARCVVIFLTVISLFLHMPYLFMADIIPGEVDEKSNETKLVCDLPEKWKEWGYILNNLDLFLTLFIPFSIIVLLNTLISKTVCRLARVRRSMTHKHSSSCSSRHHHRNRPNSSSTSSSSSSQTKVTEMLLIVSTVFICLNLPSYVFRYMTYQNMQGKARKLIVILQQMGLILYYTNFGINFALYCVSGQNFRRALTSLFCPRFRRRRTETTTVTVLSEYTRSIIHHGGSNNLNNSSMNRRKTITINGSGVDKGGDGGSLTEASRIEATSGKSDDQWNETNNC